MYINLRGELSMAKFCIKCGSPTDPETGLCPNCDAVKEEPIQAPSKFCTVCGSSKNEAGVCLNCSNNTAAPVASEKPKKAKIL